MLTEAPIHIPSYPSIHTLGHRAIDQLLHGTVVVEEKIDGSQFSMARLNGELHCRSKGRQIVIEAPEKLFDLAVGTAASLSLQEGWIYRGEYLRTPKHNTLAYSRTPARHIVLFDVEVSPGRFLAPSEKAAEAERLGLECVPVYHHGDGQELTMDALRALLERDSILGGVKVEGVVVKNYDVFTAEKKVAVGKFVSEAFKEAHRKDWKETNPSPTDFVQTLTSTLRTEARWRKAVQHLREDGALTGTPKDIGPLIAEVQRDVFAEEVEYIKSSLMAHFGSQVRRGLAVGLPEWYKKQLADSAFSDQQRPE